MGHYASYSASIIRRCLAETLWHRVGSKLSLNVKKRIKINICSPFLAAEPCSQQGKDCRRSKRRSTPTCALPAGSGQRISYEPKKKDEKNSSSVPSSIHFFDSLICCAFFPLKLIPSYLPLCIFCSLLFLWSSWVAETQTLWSVKLPLPLPGPTPAICLIAAFLLCKCAVKWCVWVFFNKTSSTVLRLALVTLFYECSGYTPRRRLHIWITPSSPLFFFFPSFLFFLCREPSVPIIFFSSLSPFLGYLDFIRFLVIGHVQSVRFANLNKHNQPPRGFGLLVHTVKYRQSARLARAPLLDFTAKGRKPYGRMLLSLYDVRTFVY